MAGTGRGQIAQPEKRRGRRTYGGPKQHSMLGDSPNFTIAYNILLQMGIYANVVMENTGLWDSRTSESLEEAWSDVKRHLGLNGNSEYNEYLMGLLRRRLTWQDGQYVWPREARSARVY